MSQAASAPHLGCQTTSEDPDSASSSKQHQEPVPAKSALGRSIGVKAKNLKPSLAKPRMASPGQPRARAAGSWLEPCRPSLSRRPSRAAGRAKPQAEPEPQAEPSLAGRAEPQALSLSRRPSRAAGSMPEPQAKPSQPQAQPSRRPSRAAGRAEPQAEPSRRPSRAPRPSRAAGRS